MVGEASKYGWSIVSDEDAVFCDEFVKERVINHFIVWVVWQYFRHALFSLIEQPFS